MIREAAPIIRESQIRPPCRNSRADVPKFAKFSIHAYIGTSKKARPIIIVRYLFMGGWSL